MRHLATLFFVLLLAASSLAQPVTKEQKDEILKGVETILLERAFVPNIDFKKWPEYLERNMEAIDKAEDQNAFVTAVNRTLRNFGISHVGLRSPRASQNRRTTSTIGVGLSAVRNDEGLVVRSLFPKSPADEAGIKPGDTIIEVDGKVPDSPAVLNGDEGTEIKVKVKSATGEVREVTLPRKRFSTARPDTLTWLDDETAVLKIHSFSGGYNQQNINNMMKEAAKAKFLVLDLRSNGGGAVNNLRHLLGLLLPNDSAIGVFINRQMATSYLEATKAETMDVGEIAKWTTNHFKTRKEAIEPFTGKMAVLINRGSGSASEICAAALRELHGAPLIGARTAGAVLASTYGRLPHGFEIQYPVTDYVSIKGLRLERNPLVPDIEITGAGDGEKDPYIEKALEKLKG